ncbi:flagellin lysine-N-methylase, partial [Hungatella sp.]
SAFRQYDRRCAFLDENNLCDIYSEAGPSMLCRTCRAYPRHIEEFEGVREISLSLSCPEAAKLILDCKEPVRFLSKETEKEETYPFFDFFLYTKLMDCRDVIISTLQNRELDWNLRAGIVLGLAHDLQRRIVNDRLYETDSLLERYGRKGAVEKLASRLLAYQIDGDSRFEGMKELFGFLDGLEVLNAGWPDYIGRVKEVLYGAGENAYEEQRQEFYEYLESEEERLETWERWSEQLMVYFVFTWFCGAEYDERPYGKMKLAVVSTLLIRETAQALWKEQGGVLEKDAFFEAARRYSREVEHSDLNLERLETLFREKKVCSLDRLLTLVMG